MKDGISISDMAQIHGLTRQTLIYYDKIGLFKPENVDCHGYRYYSYHQIPMLREICFLKNAGVPLKEILKHFTNRTPEHELIQLHEQKHDIERKIGELNKLREAITMRIDNYQAATDARRMKVSEPFIRHFDERTALYRPYIMPIDRKNLHLTVMSIWQELNSDEFIPSGNFGSILKPESIEKGEPLEGAGSCVFLLKWSHVKTKENKVVEIPAGDYACLFSVQMPYEGKDAAKLLSWIRENHMEPAGNIIDVCLLDATFYNEELQKDFCMIQIPVREVKE